MHLIPLAICFDVGEQVTHPIEAAIANKSVTALGVMVLAVTESVIVR